MPHIYVGPAVLKQYAWYFGYRLIVTVYCLPCLVILKDFCLVFISLTISTFLRLRFEFTLLIGSIILRLIKLTCRFCNCVYFYIHVDHALYIFYHCCVVCLTVYCHGFIVLILPFKKMSLNSSISS